VTTANVTDRDGALPAIGRCRVNLERVESVLLDVGYTGQPIADGVMERIKATVQVVKRNELHAFVVLPKR
jgi:transposase